MIQKAHALIVCQNDDQDKCHFGHVYTQRYTYWCKRENINHKVQDCITFQHPQIFQKYKNHIYMFYRVRKVTTTSTAIFTAPNLQTRDIYALIEPSLTSYESLAFSQYIPEHFIGVLQGLMASRTWKEYVNLVHYINQQSCSSFRDVKDSVNSWTSNA